MSKKKVILQFKIVKLKNVWLKLDYFYSFFIKTHHATNRILPNLWHEKLNFRLIVFCLKTVRKLDTMNWSYILKACFLPVPLISSEGTTSSPLTLHSSRASAPSTAVIRPSSGTCATKINKNYKTFPILWLMVKCKNSGF